MHGRHGTARLKQNQRQEVNKINEAKAEQKKTKTSATRKKKRRRTGTWQKSSVVEGLTAKEKPTKPLRKKGPRRQSLTGRQKRNIRRKHSLKKARPTAAWGQRTEDGERKKRGRGGVVGCRFSQKPRPSATRAARGQSTEGKKGGCQIFLDLKIHRGKTYPHTGSTTTAKKSWVPSKKRAPI